MSNYCCKNCFVVSVIFFVAFAGVSGADLVDDERINMVKLVDSETNYSITDDIYSNQYWGSSDIKLTNGTGFFEVIEQDGTWWLVTPDGYAFYSVGLNAVSPEDFYLYNLSILEKYGSHTAWANATLDRLSRWGFNTLGAWSRSDLFSQVPYTHTFIFRHEGRTDWKRFVNNHPDVFDPLWQGLVRSEIEKVAKTLKNDSYLVGYWLDNEMHWGPDEDDCKTLLENYISALYTCPGKQRAVNFLMDRYAGDAEEFNRVWNMDLNNFNELFDKQELGREGWRIMSMLKLTKLRLFRQDPKLFFDLEILEKAADDIKNFSRLVADTYFNFTSSIIEENDPNHLILGVRFHCAEGVPEEIIEECGEYCDIVSINYYGRHLIVYDPTDYMRCLIRGVVPLDKWMQRYHDISGKPLIVGEFPYNYIDCKLFGNSYWPKKMFNIEDFRTYYSEIYTRKCLKAPYIVGHHGWYVDSDGLVDLYDNENTVLIERMTYINSMIYELHGS